MIYGKIWCVVKPSTGIPLFLSAVAIGSFLVHYMLLTNTTWLKQFFEGKPRVVATESSSSSAAVRK
jgi:light-harvesting protein B-800-850 alpha chain